MKRDFLKIFLIILITGVIWFGLFSAPFLWDDDGIIVNNVFINSLISVKFLFSKFYFNVFGELSYRPVVTLSHILDTVIFGKNPESHHCMNLLMHIINSILFYLILKKVPFLDNYVKFFAAVVFAVHPVHLETLFVVAYRDELLMTMFLLIAWLAYLSFQQNAKKRFAFISVLSFLLSVFSKETGIVFLPLILFTDRIVFKRKILKNKWFYLSVLCACLFWGLIRFVYMINPEEYLRNVEFASHFSPLFRPTIIVALAARACLVPLNVVLDYHNKSVLLFQTIQGGIVTAGLIVFLVLARNKKGVFLALIIILSGLFPVMNIYRLENFFANRYMYLPSMGFALILCIFISYVCSEKRRIKQIIYLLIVILMCTATLRGTRFFRSDDAFARKLLSDSPRSYKALNYLGTEELEKGNLDSAYEYFTKALDINSDYYESIYNLSLLYSDRGENEQAFQTASTLLELNPDNSHGYRLIGDILYSINLLDEAADYYKEALKVNKYDIQTANNLGLIYEAQNRLDEAVTLYVSLLSIYPKFDLAWSNLGNVNIKRRDYGFAERCFISALEIEPYNSKTWYNLGNAYYHQKKYDKAEKCYLESSKLDNTFADPLYNLVVIYLSQNKKREAVNYLEKYLVLVPSDKNAVQTLDMLKKQSPKN